LCLQIELMRVARLRRLQRIYGTLTGKKTNAERTLSAALSCELCGSFGSAGYMMSRIR